MSEFSFEALAVEQTAIQQAKVDDRVLRTYNDYLFNEADERTPGTSYDELSDFLADSLTNSESLLGLLDGLATMKGDEPIEWTDMGGGWALAMREVATYPQLRNRVSMTNVEARDLSETSLPERYQDLRNYLSLLDNLNQRPAVSGLIRILENRYAPRLIRADATTIDLATPQDFISSIYSLQYFSDPLQALCNWYNQLSDHGILFVANDGRWSQGISQEDGGPVPLTDELFTSLREQGAQIATRNRSIPFGRIALQRVPSTSLRLTARATSSHTRPPGEGSMRAVTYSRNTSTEPVIQLVTA